MQKADYISQTNLAKSLNVCKMTLLKYLCRAEFAHIFPFHIGRYLYYKNFTDEDISRLKELCSDTRGRKKRCSQ